MALRGLACRRRRKGPATWRRNISYYDINQPGSTDALVAIVWHKIPPEIRSKRRSEILAKANAPLSDSDYEALANLRYTLRRFLDFSASAAKSAGLPSQQHQALLAIKGHRAPEPMTIGMLASRLLIAPHTAAELVGRLEAAGLVERHTDPGDKRRQALTLTMKSEAIMRELSDVHLKEIRDLTPELIAILRSLSSE